MYYIKIFYIKKKNGAAIAAIDIVNIRSYVVFNLYYKKCTSGK